MLIKILIFLAVFGASFFLVRMLYPFLEEGLNRWQKKRIANITPKLNRMFMDVPLAKLILLDTLAPVVCAVAGYLLTKNIWAAVGCAAAGLSIPVIVVKRMEAIRRQKFASQLVDSLLILSSSLKAGLSLLQAFEEIVNEMPAPISQEFALAIRQMQMGVALDEAMTQMKKRMRLDELDLVVTAMLVARETGGDLTITFSRVISTIQERNKLIGKVRALCIQGKLQGAIMSLLPIAFAIFVYQSNPHFFDIFFNDNTGRMLFIYAIISEVLGIFFIRKLSKVDV
ncbi:MAG: type II secretion system F family protein [Candidatus Omnitrophota bacterium]